jgi:uncharacterized membrane protein HdeD (DUF308 family)
MGRRAGGALIEERGMSGLVHVNRSDISILVAGLAGAWWTFLLRGLAALSFGAAALLWPSQALSTLTIVFGIYAAIDAVAALVTLLVGPGDLRGRWWLALLGLTGAIAALATFVWPEQTATIVIYLIAAWACLSGALQLGGGIMLRREIEGESLLVVSGAISVFFGITLFGISGAGLPMLMWTVALYSIVYGMIMVGVGLMLRMHLQA